MIYFCRSEPYNLVLEIHQAKNNDMNKSIKKCIIWGLIRQVCWTSVVLQFTGRLVSALWQVSQPMLPCQSDQWTLRTLLAAWLASLNAGWANVIATANNLTSRAGRWQFNPWRAVRMAGILMDASGKAFTHYRPQKRHFCQRSHGKSNINIISVIHGILFYLLT